MFGFLSNHSDHILGIARILFGINFATHGAQKLFGVLGGVQGAMPAWLLYPAGAIELVGGVLIALGLFTRWAGFIASGQMAVAYLGFHFGMNLAQGFSAAFWPILNRGEIAIAYCWFFLYVAAVGPGSWSLDAMRGGGAAEAPAS